MTLAPTDQPATVNVRWTLPTGIADLLVAFTEWNTMLDRQAPMYNGEFGENVEPRPRLHTGTVVERVANVLPFDADQQFRTIGRAKARKLPRATVRFVLPAALVAALRAEARDHGRTVGQHVEQVLGDILPRILTDAMMLYITRGKALADKWDEDHPESEEDRK